MKTRRILNISVIAIGLGIGLYRVRSIGPWTPVTITSAAFIVFMAAVGIVISDRPQNFSTTGQAGANTKNRKLAVVWLGGIAIFFVLLAGWLGHEALAVQRWEHAERDWPAAEGVIRSWSIRSSVDKRSGRATWSPYWAYSFTVGGKRFDGTSIDITAGYNAHWYATAAAAEFDALSRPVGAVVPVYYDPVHPQQSVLDRRTFSTTDWVFWSLCALPLGAVTLLCWAILRILTSARVQAHPRSR